LTPELTTAVSPAPDPQPPRAPARPVRLWSPVAVLAFYWAARFVLGRLDTFYFVGFLFNLASSAFLTVFFTAWWCANRRIPFRDRLYGFLLFAGGALLVGFLSHRSVGWWGLFLSGLPVVLTAWLVWAVVARTAFPTWLRPGSAVVVALAWAVFTLVRIDGLDSDLRADLHWRWHPSAEDLFLVEKQRAAGSVPDAGAAARAEASGTAGPTDWPAFRGPDRDGVVRGVTIATDWAAHPPHPLWRQRVGPAWSSVIVVGDRLYTQEQRGELEAVLCYDARTGHELWAHTDTARFWESVSGAGPRATPAYADGRVYALGATGLLNCLDAATGKRHWSRDAAAEAGARPPQWGFSGSPLVIDGAVVVFAGGGGDRNLLAYRADTGEPAWAAHAGSDSYASPQPAVLGGRHQCLILSDRGLTAVDPAAGAVLWTGGAAMPGAPRTGQPHAVGEGQLLVGTYEGPGVSLVDVSRDGDAWKAVPRWTSKDLRPEFPDFVVYQGHAYGFDVSVFCCIDLAAGKRCWKAGRYGRGQVVLLADQGLLLVISENGEAILLAADPGRHRELGRFRALEGKTWNHPVVAHGRLYARNAEEMACYDLAPAAAGE
jgi:outer membrane protein assembly factor BamB